MGSAQRIGMRAIGSAVAVIGMRGAQRIGITARRTAIAAIGMSGAQRIGIRTGRRLSLTGQSRVVYLGFLIPFIHQHRIRRGRRLRGRIVSTADIGGIAYGRGGEAIGAIDGIAYLGISAVRAVSSISNLGINIPVGAVGGIAYARIGAVWGEGGVAYVGISVPIRAIGGIAYTSIRTTGKRWGAFFIRQILSLARILARSQGYDPATQHPNKQYKIYSFFPPQKNSEFFERIKILVFN